MKTWVQIPLLASILTLTCSAQQPGPPPQAGVRMMPGMQQRIEPSTNNYRLELEMKRGDKTARYLLTFNSGAFSTELIDKLADPKESIEPRTIQFHSSFTPFENAGGEVSITLGRSVPFKVMNPVPNAPAGTQRETTQFKSITLLTKVALFPGKAVTIFDDEDEKISLKLTSL